MLEALLEGDFDGLAQDARRAAPARWITVAPFLAALVLNCGAPAGAAWGAGVLASEAWTCFAARQAADGHRSGVASRLSFLGSLAAFGLLWSVMALAYWASGSEPMRLFAVLIWMGTLILAQGASFKVRAGALAFGGPSLLALVAAPMALGGFSGLGLATVGLGVLCAAAHLLHFAGQNWATGEALRRARAELIEQTEAANAANQAKSAFLAMMSHELRTPMNGLLGMSRALRQTPLDARQAEYVEMLVRSGDGLMVILNDILDISKVEAGKLELERVVFDLREVGQGVHDLWTETASAKGVLLTYAFEPSAPQWVLGDPTRMRQIMQNLVSNAVKFTARGEVRLAVRSVRGLLEVSVSDSGPGLSESQQARLFQSFAQADVSTSRKFGGTGLGLAICRQLAELMGGSITLASRLGEGSCFTVAVPLARADAPSQAHQAEEQATLTGVRILVADDNTINQMVALTILESVGAEVVTAGDGAEALAQLRTAPFDVVLMDVHMPTMDGVETLQRIRAGEGGDPAVPIIALTADAMSGANERLLEQGFDGAQPKPIDTANLIATIAALSSGSLSRALAAVA